MLILWYHLCPFSRYLSEHFLRWPVATMEHEVHHVFRQMLVLFAFRVTSIEFYKMNISSCIAWYFRTPSRNDFDLLKWTRFPPGKTVDEVWHSVFVGKEFSVNCNWIKSLQLNIGSLNLDFALTRLNALEFRERKPYPRLFLHVGCVGSHFGHFLVRRIYWISWTPIF